MKLCSQEEFLKPGPFITPWFMKSIGKSLPRVCFHGLPHYFRGHGTLAEAKSVSSGPSWHDYYSLQRGHREPKACWVGAPQQQWALFYILRDLVLIKSKIQPRARYSFYSQIRTSKVNVCVFWDSIGLHITL